MNTLKPGLDRMYNIGLESVETNEAKGAKRYHPNLFTLRIALFEDICTYSSL